jgi:hypothetical protein
MSGALFTLLNVYLFGAGKEEAFSRVSP